MTRRTWKRRLARARSAQRRDTSDCMVYRGAIVRFRRVDGAMVARKIVAPWRRT